MFSDDPLSGLTISQLKELKNAILDAEELEELENSDLPDWIRDEYYKVIEYINQRIINIGKDKVRDIILYISNGKD